jgi:tetratricopeptide (TPR) repeat protein
MNLKSFVRGATVKRKCIDVLAVVALFSLFVTGCSERRETSPLFLLEELEAASAVDDPEGRIERLEIFLKNHSDHSYRKIAYDRILDALTDDLSDPARAETYFKDVLGREEDPQIRGSVLFWKFSKLWKADKEEALSLARELVSGQETYFRLFLYMAYYLIWDEDYEKNADLAEKVLEKAVETSSDDYERRQAIAVLGGLKERLGERDEALEILEPVAGTYDADEIIARILWDKGERERALGAYIRSAAVVPGARKSSSLDSLYALVYRDTSELDAKIWEERIIDGGKLPPQSLVDIEGRRFDLADFKGVKLIVNIWQPT